MQDFLDDFYSVQNFILPNARRGVEPFASRIKLPKDAKIPQFASPSVINILSVGGAFAELCHLFVNAPERAFIFH